MMKTAVLKLGAFVVFGLLLLATCKKDDPVTDFTVSDVTIVDNTIKINGKITSLSGNNNGEYGVCYTTKNNPQITDSVMKLGAPKVGTFTAEIKNLGRNKTYYFRAFIKEGDKYLYDQVRSALITAIPPTVTSKAATTITENTATLNGSVNASGVASSVSFEYGLTTAYGNTITAKEGSISGNSNSDVSADLTSLAPSTTYHFRVKAVNSAGTTLGEDLTFKTVVVLASTVTSSAAISITNTTATINGSVNPNGSSTTVTFEYGTTFMYGSTANATPGTVSGIIPSTVSAGLSGLISGQLYHFRVKAVSAGGTTYGEDLTFTTTQPPSATTQSATAIAQTIATLNGLVNANGLATTILFEYGATISYGNLVNGVPDNATGSAGTAISANITGLTANTTYHFRIKAVSSAGTGNGEDFSFTTTQVPNLPTISTNAITNLTGTTVISGGNITSNGGESISASGVCWSTTANPVVSGSHTSDGTLSGSFSSTISGLTPGTEYFVRAYATNSSGTGYGDDVIFTTLLLPTAVTLTAVNIYPTTATLNGYVNAKDNLSSIKFEYGTTTSYGTVLLGIPDNATGAVDVYSTVNLTGLTRSTLYHYRIIAENSTGKTYGNDMTFTTLLNDPVVPTLTTKNITDITYATATGGGIISSDGGAEVTTRGICYSTSPAPTINDFRTSNDSGTGEYSSPFTGLSPSTLYYVRAYATNLIGIAYGNQVTFTSAPPPAVFPTVTTTTISGITWESAASGGNITNDGGGAISAKGVCWSTTENPTIGNSKTNDGTGSGVFTSNIAGLNAGTLYYVKAYATNSAGTSYGNQETFVTSDTPAGLATLTTTAGSDITTSTISTGGNVTSDGGGNVTQKGICYGTSTGPTISGSKTNDGIGTGIFISNLNGLSPSTKYYIRAYATNSAGTAYGNEVTATTSAPAPVLPTVTTDAVTAITYNSGTGGGNVTSEGNATVTARGVCWSTSSGPTTVNSKTTNSTGAGSFTSSITSLIPDTKYYVRAYATNSVGTAYGNEVSFTTSPPPYTLATLTTTSATGVTSSLASPGGNISADGGATVTARGVCYGTSASPTINGNFTTNGSGTGSFTDNLSGLSASTMYYVRAYATNAAGTAYGNQITFTTDPVAGAPILTTTAASAINSTTATSGGNIIDDGDGTLGSVTITAKGVCWSTSANPTTALATKTSDGTGTGIFTSNITGLTPCTQYHVRAYALNSANFTAYGSDEIFTTASVLPTVVTTALTSPTSTSVSTGGNISGNCSSAVTERGVCYGTSTGPLTSGSKLINGTGSGSYTINITGLTPCTTYYIRSYAINDSGIQYGNELIFTTSTVAASVTTTAATSITSTTATSGGTVSGNCTTGANRGICYGTTSNPTTANSVIYSGSGAGSYSIGIPGLTPCTFYYVRAFVTNGAGTAYATQTSFTTGSALASVTTTAISGITATTAVSGGTPIGDCISGITAKGICWSTSPGPTTALATKTNHGAGSGFFTSTMTGLTRVTTYYVRSYVTNLSGTSYGDEISFSTIAALPTVGTYTISIYSNSEARSSGIVYDDGGATVTDRGVCWSTSYNPTISNSTASEGTGTGSYTANISGLTASTLYYARAYATNSSGTSYGGNASIITTAFLIDINDNIYGTVYINGQTWMQSNLKVTGWANAPISGGSDTSQVVALPMRWSYNDNSSYASSYGYMYNWAAVTSSYNICPTGWHVPSQTEWTTLANNLGNYTAAGSKMNQFFENRFVKFGYLRYYFWNSTMTGHDNSSLFYGRGGGYYSGAYYGLLDNTRWWTSTVQRFVSIQYNSNYIYGIGSSQTGLASDAYYIRCKKD